MVVGVAVLGHLSVQTVPKPASRVSQPSPRRSDSWSLVHAGEVEEARRQLFESSVADFVRLRLSQDAKDDVVCLETPKAQLLQLPGRSSDLFTAGRDREPCGTVSSFVCDVNRRCNDRTEAGQAAPLLACGSTAGDAGSEAGCRRKA